MAVSQREGDGKVMNSGSTINYFFRLVPLTSSRYNQSQLVIAGKIHLVDLKLGSTVRLDLRCALQF